MRFKVLTIRVLVALLTFTAGTALKHFSMGEQRTNPTQVINPQDEATVVFEGVVLKIGPQVPGSGRLAFYRLAKYRVDKVSYGHYAEPEIVVDHLSLSTHELDGIEEGNRVCVTVSRSKKILSRFNVNGIRAENERVDTFYLGDAVHSGSCYQ